MPTPNFRPKWLPNQSNYVSKRNSPEWLQNASIRTWRTAGLLLFVLSLTIVLSACQPVVIRQACDPYPLPDSKLMEPPLNLHLVPQSMLPSAKPSSTTPSSTPPK